MSHELINQNYIHRGRVFDVSLSRFNSEAKGEVEIEIVHHNGGAGALPLFEDGSVALVRQWRYPLARYSLEICAGRIEPGQTPEETGARELEEGSAIGPVSLENSASSMWLRAIAMSGYSYI
jgi:ADP-ribose pyrophosphatase